MKKVAIVVQRCHGTVVGGSESLAWHYASLLKDTYDVDLLTTTALDISGWANVLPEGSEEKNGINVIRFPVTVGRNAYWAQLHHRLSGGFDPFTPGRQRNSEKTLQLKWTVALQEEFIKNQGPYSATLMKFIRENWRAYQSIIFVTYLYPTTYFGLQQLPPGKALFVPTLHDEQPAYLSAYKHAAARARALLWLTEAEQRVSRRLWGDLPGRVVGMAIDTKPREPEISHVPYLLYCGRVDPNKGCAQLFEFYFKYKRATRSRLRLVITGTADMEIPPHADIDFRGFVSSEEKFRLMAGAAAYVVPSPNESFSIVTLEAMAQQTPVLASGRSEVMVDHINRSGGGKIYNDYETFQAGLSALLRGNGRPKEMATAGRDYVISNYQKDEIKNRLIDAIESKTGAIAPNVQGSRTEPESFRFDRDQFAERFNRNLRTCVWQEHPLYNPFTQYDQEYYLAQRNAFVHKYRCFYAVSRTISPRSLIELGACAGASADAYLSASPTAQYVGLDVFGLNKRHDDNSVWDPYEIATALFKDRGFQNWQLIRQDLRSVQHLSSKADLVVVDAAHDFSNEYEDLKLAVTADPTFIFIDDADDENGARPAIEKFIREDLRGRIDYLFHISYLGGGLVIKLREDGTKHYDLESTRTSLTELPEKKVIVEPRGPVNKTPITHNERSSTIIRNTAPSSPASHTLTLHIGDQVHKISLNLHNLGDTSGEYLYVRPMTYDDKIVEGVAVCNEYALPERFQTDDILIDIGAHVGAFSYAALTRGAGKVYSYEAHPTNHAIAFHNLAKFGQRVVCRNMAVWRSDQPDQILYNDPLTGLDKLNTGGITVLWNNEGIPVPTVSLDELLREASDDFRKPIRLLKLDCEGSEYPILFTSKHLEIVREICGEYHEILAEHVPVRAQVGSRSDRFNRAGLRDYLEEQGFSVELEHHAENVGVFHARRNRESNHAS